MKKEHCSLCQNPIQQPKTGVRLFCESCFTERRRFSKKAQMKEWSEKNREELAKRKREIYQTIGVTEEAKRLRSIKTKETRVRLKEQILLHYGKRCNCCGEERVEFLTIDHVNNDGNVHRKEVGNHINLYRWIIKNQFPVSLQILCFNCNCSKGFFGYCPHEKEKANH